ncbi:MFS transporter [Labrys monachus]|uniref:MFS family arabinose efflux permease n=1 Tax=Labrys monachus TaxID=217067 RepID=A0ABU0FKK8_9HYPH|nr:MFS transporter [Labrys monachus]MDQ0395134.1 putative MFS family arabinose efflux permease [Labrys monachus]
MAAVTEEAAGQPKVSAWLIFLLAASCGLLAANVYYPQPLAGPIGAALGLSPHATGLIVTLTQLGYGTGLLLVVPLGDLVENRKLVLALVGLATLALLGAALSTQPAAFLASAFFIGLGSVAVQVLVPYAAHLAPEAVRGRVVGNVMSGLMLGIMLARPISSLVAELSSWHVVFFLSAGAMVALALVLGFGLPKRVPASRLSYGALLASMGRLLLTTPILQRRTLYHVCLFGAFSLFWTTTPLLLAGPAFRLSQGGIALFALAGVAGAVAAPIAGRVADRGWSRPATALAMMSAAAAFLVTHLAPPGSPLALGLLVVAANLLDFGVSSNLVLGQRAIYALGAEFRSRLNGLYMAIFFGGGAVGSAVGGWAYAQGGWALASWIGLALPVAALLCFATE